MARSLVRRATGASVVALSFVSLAAGCVGEIAPGDEEDLGQIGEAELQAFVDRTYKEPWSDGVWIVDGDTPIESLKQLREFHARLHTPGGLIVHRSGSADAAWSSAQKRNLTYCVSDRFGTNKAKVVQGMKDATAAWEAAAA